MLVIVETGGPLVLDSHFAVAEHWVEAVQVDHLKVHPLPTVESPASLSSFC
jgi:hypothetical protein